MSGAKLFSEWLLESSGNYTTKEELSHAVARFNYLSPAKQAIEAKKILNSAENIGYHIKSQNILKYKQNDKTIKYGLSITTKDELKGYINTFSQLPDDKKEKRAKEILKSAKDLKFDVTDKNILKYSENN